MSNKSPFDRAKKLARELGETFESCIDDLKHLNEELKKLKDEHGEKGGKRDE